MGANTNKKSNAGKNVLVFFIVFIILEMLIIFGVGKVFKNKDVTPSFAGYSLYMTNSELTAKKDDGTYEVSVPKNVLVIASNGLTNATEKIGTAVLCEKVEGVGTGVFWLADVNSNEGGDGVVYTISNGDKYYSVTSQNIVGGTSSYFKTAGTVITFITSKFGMIVCAVVPLFFLVLIELIIAIATHSPEEEEDEEEEDEEPEEVKLDDFLFGGQNEGEQIAKRRHQLEQQQTEQSYQEPENISDLSEKTDDFDFDFSRKSVQEEPKAEPIATDDDLKMSEYYEKASKLVDEAAAEPAPAPKPVKKPAQRRPRPQGQRPSQRSARTASDIGSASLEDLMKLMEEEQIKLKNQMK